MKKTEPSDTCHILKTIDFFFFKLCFYVFADQLLAWEERWNESAGLCCHTPVLPGPAGLGGLPRWIGLRSCAAPLRTLWRSAAGVCGASHRWANLLRSRSKHAQRWQKIPHSLSLSWKKRKMCGKKYLKKKKSLCTWDWTPLCVLSCAETAAVLGSWSASTSRVRSLQSKQPAERGSYAKVCTFPLWRNWKMWLLSHCSDPAPPPFLIFLF